MVLELILQQWCSLAVARLTFHNMHLEWGLTLVQGILTCKLHSILYYVGSDEKLYCHTATWFVLKKGLSTSAHVPIMSKFLKPIPDIQ